MTILTVTMNKLPVAKQAAVVKALTEGASIRATARMVGVSKTTVLKLLGEVGSLCETYQWHVLRNLPCKRVQCDEIWGFVGAKARAVREGAKAAGDVWTWVAMCADTKLMITWAIGPRNMETAWPFMHDLASRLANRVQLTTDGFRAYLMAVDEAFAGDVDYAMLQKLYGPSPEPKGRYSPPVCTGAIPVPVLGDPDPKHVSTSFIERQNLTMRMQMRRMTRLTNAFSRKVENHRHAMALHFMAYNFCRAHGTLTKRADGVHTSPAMAAGLTDHVWKIEELVALMDRTRPLG
jgi:IS1 family transposase